jgi:hypothetical protein
MCLLMVAACCSTNSFRKGRTSCWWMTSGASVVGRERHPAASRVVRSQIRERASERNY